ncbi:glycosyltransferase family 4 protein [Flavobacterium psychrotrophum]|uniref:glycosyltransferase family 4 protein n=1 Tax=Flavobacterium psychrotrophum TaxID=2294119 RepID=UPI000E31AFE7|nr:glycosyltransferase family 1 protein [Flavobacterium psychrotrophum]
MIIINARFLTQPITGVQRYAIEICKRIRLEYSNDELIFVAPHNLLDNELAKELNVIVVGKRSGHIWEQIELPLYLKKLKKNNDGPLLLNLCNTAPLLYNNKIVTIHDVAFEVFPETYSKNFLRVYKFMIPRIIKQSKHVITVSAFSKNEIVKYYNTAASKISVIYNAVSDLFYHSKDKGNVNQPYFTAVSSLNFRKNLPLVLDAFSLVYKKSPQVSLYIIGGFDSKSFSSLNLSKYENHPAIHFTGRITDEELVMYYSNALGFLYPSLYEGFGIPPLEAQKCGTPAILSNESCLPEIFKDSVLYCNAYQPEDMALKMQQLLDEPGLMDKLVAAGYKNNEDYSWDSSAEKVKSILDNFNE